MALTTCQCPCMCRLPAKKGTRDTLCAECMEIQKLRRKLQEADKAILEFHYKHHHEKG